MTLLPIFNDQINLEANQLSEYNTARNDILKYVDINSANAVRHGT